MSTIARNWTTLPERRPAGTLVVAVVACIAVGASGSVFTAMGLESWYPSLAKPALAPPNWVFAPVWTTLFTLMGVAVWLVWRAAGRGQATAARRALLVFGGHFVVNVAWSAVFFGAQSTLGGLVVIVVLWLAIVATIAAFARVDRRAAALLVPYLAWVSFAGYLNYALWTLN